MKFADFWAPNWIYQTIVWFDPWVVLNMSFLSTHDPNLSPLHLAIFPARIVRRYQSNRDIKKATFPQNAILQPTSLPHLPDDVWHIILSHSPTPTLSDLFNLSSVSPSFFMSCTPDSHGSSRCPQPNCFPPQKALPLRRAVSSSS